MDADITHVADIEDPHSASHCSVFSYQSASCGILDRHVPTAEIDHLCAQEAMQRIQRGLAKLSLCGRVGRFHSDAQGKKTILARSFKAVKNWLIARKRC